MNLARRRRSVISARARLAMFKRLMRERRGRKSENVDVLKSVLRARVYLVVDDMGEDEFSTSVIVDLPRDNPTKVLRNMQKYGFWVPRPHLGILKYIAPQQIRQVHMEVS